MNKRYYNHFKFQSSLWIAGLNFNVDMLRHSKPTLTHWGLVTHICISKHDHYCRSAPSHFPNQCWFIVNLTLQCKIQWNFNLNSNFSLTKMNLKRLFVKWWPFCLGLNVFISETCLTNLIRGHPWELIRLIIRMAMVYQDRFLRYGLPSRRFFDSLWWRHN